VGAGGHAGEGVDAGGTAAGADATDGGSGVGAAEGGGSSGVGQVGGSAGIGAGGDGGRLAECETGFSRCDPYQPMKCETEWVPDGGECVGFCADGACREAPSCGPDTATTPCVGGTSCCDTIWVPAGDYEMGAGDDENPSTYHRVVSDFYLDRFEVTVGRFAAFVSDYSLPGEGDGEHPKIAGSGWREEWETLEYSPGIRVVPASREELLAQLASCSAESNTWGGPQDLPINCVSWYVAFAFCVYDGGRLPTEAEWNYAAAHGRDHLPYPWSDSVSDLTIDTSLATYFEWPGPLLDLPTAVGSHDAGRGRYARNDGQGHDDLSGNVAEWVLDQWTEAPAPSCSDCMEAWSQDERRVTRGGSFQVDSSYLLTGHRTWSPASNLSHLYGMRCARDLGGTVRSSE
jgi:sulfatase modifying factor 1